MVALSVSKSSEIEVVSLSLPFLFDRIVAGLHKNGTVSLMRVNCVAGACQARARATSVFGDMLILVSVRSLSSLTNFSTGFGERQLKKGMI